MSGATGRSDGTGPSAASRPGGQEGEADSGLCDSCGRDEADLVAVHRVYAAPESWESPATVQRLDEVELWCFSCVSHYPHELVGADP